MDLLVIDADVEQPDDLDRRRLFIRVAAWWSDEHPSDSPDAVLDFLLAAPEKVTHFTEDRLGRRRTVSGRWLMAGRVEVDGEWVSEDPDDPWERVEVDADPLPFVWPVIVNAARARRLEEFVGHDTFHPAEVDLDQARRDHPHGERVRALIGYRETVA